MTTFNITCICTVDPTKILHGLRKSIDTLKDKIDITKVYWVSDTIFPLDHFPIDAETILISPFNGYTDDYNYITLHLLPEKVSTDFSLIIHPDGFAVNVDAWTDEFLEYDYIGAVWPQYDHYNVGNGGFSLRSKNLYESLKKFKFSYKFDDLKIKVEDIMSYSAVDVFNDRVVPEDNIIGRLYRKQLEDDGIKFAPPEVADRFSIEHNLSSSWLGKSLGFHGKHGVAAHYGESV